jgi:hypothetical protein
LIVQILTPAPSSMSFPQPPLALPIFEDTTIPNSSMERIFCFKYPADGSHLRNYVYAAGQL